MNHAIIYERNSECESTNSFIECNIDENNTVFLCESEYTIDEMKLFDNEKDKWILKHCGSQNFIADSDSGEDAYGSYEGYFDLKPEYAVFSDEKCIGFYFSPGDFSYSGTCRGNYRIDDWGYPGYAIDGYKPPRAKFHLFLFDDVSTHYFAGWTLLQRENGKVYINDLSF